ncbi:MAG: hypothetical protein WC138_09665 [Methanoculleus sp.]
MAGLEHIGRLGDLRLTGVERGVRDVAVGVGLDDVVVDHLRLEVRVRLVPDDLPRLLPDRVRDLDVSLGPRVEEVLGVARVVLPYFRRVNILKDLLVSGERDIRREDEVAVDRPGRDLVVDVSKRTNHLRIIHISRLTRSATARMAGA